MAAPHTTKATNINVLNFKTVPMRTFLLPGSPLFLCFLGWFGLAGFLFASETIAYRESLFTIGTAATIVSFVSLALSLSKNATPEATHVGVLNRRHGSKISTWKKNSLTYKLRIQHR